MFPLGAVFRSKSPIHSLISVALFRPLSLFPRVAYRCKTEACVLRPASGVCRDVGVGSLLHSSNLLQWIVDGIVKEI